MSNIYITEQDTKDVLETSLTTKDKLEKILSILLDCESLDNKELEIKIAKKIRDYPIHELEYITGYVIFKNEDDLHNYVKEEINDYISNY